MPLEGLLGDPLFGAGMGLLQASGPSLTPVNPWAGAYGGLLNAQKFKNAQALLEQKKQAQAIQQQVAQAQLEAVNRKAAGDKALQDALNSGDPAKIQQALIGAAPATAAAAMFKPTAPVNVAAGGTLVDPSTGKPIYQAPADPSKLTFEQRMQIAKLRAADPNKPPVGYRWGAAGKLEAIPGGPADAAGAESLLTPEAQALAAAVYTQTGQTPALGMGNKAGAARIGVINRAAQDAAAAGMTPQEYAIKQQFNKAEGSGLRQLSAQQQKIESFSRTADMNAAVAEELSGKVDRTGVPAVNRWLLAGKKSIAGDPDVAAFDAAVRTYINEYAKITNSATGGGVSSDSARKEIEQLLSTAETPEQFRAVLAVTRRDTNNRLQGYAQTRAGVRGRMAGESAPVQGDASGLTPAEQAELDALRKRFGK